MDINDTGIGMTEETAGRIFRPFERADNVEQVKGFELGLSITKGLVALLDGTIDVTSTPEKGTVFQVSIPLALTEETALSYFLTRDPANSLCLPHCVIIIDDDASRSDPMNILKYPISVS